MFLGLLIPFIGTTLGSFLVFFIKGDLKTSVQKFLLGFASGVMIAASVWSLLIPAIDMNDGYLSWVLPSFGFLLGILFLLVLDSIIPHLHLSSDKPEGIKSSLKRTTMLILAVTLHNIPEGMAVGVVFSGLLSGNADISLAGAYALSLGIAIQNFPEGAIISMPLRAEGNSRFKSFLYGTLSGVVEPISAVLIICLSKIFVPILPVLLSFAAGAMIYVVVEELIPEANCGEHSNIGVIGVSIGFVLMMILDVALG